MSTPTERLDGFLPVFRSTFTPDGPSEYRHERCGVIVTEDSTNRQTGRMDHVCPDRAGRPPTTMESVPGGFRQGLLTACRIVCHHCAAGVPVSTDKFGPAEFGDRGRSFFHVLTFTPDGCSRPRQFLERCRASTLRSVMPVER